MTSKAEFAEFYKQLLAMNHGDLTKAVADYALSDEGFYQYLRTIVLLKQSNCLSAYISVAAQIGRLYGNDNLPASLEQSDLMRFSQLQDLIQRLLDDGMVAETIKCCELSLDYVENLAGVHHPDDFLTEAYDPIIKTWIKALKASGMDEREIADKLTSLQKRDDYGIFYNLQESYAKGV